MITIVSTRFTTNTLKENRDYRNKKRLTCVYGSPLEISKRVLYDSLVFVIEMNNDENQIEGIGLIRNHMAIDKYYNIHYDGNYNRYVYKSKFFVGRDTIERYNSKLVAILDYILFKEKTHLKRSSGFTVVPEKLLKHKKCENLNLVNEIKSIFVFQFSEEN